MNGTSYKFKFNQNLVKILDIFLFVLIFITIKENYNITHLFNIQTFFNTQFFTSDLIKLFIIAFIWRYIFFLIRLNQIRITGNENWFEVMIRTIITISISTLIVLIIADMMGIISTLDGFNLTFLLTIIPVFMIYKGLFFGFVSITQINQPTQRSALIVGRNNRSMTLLNRFKNKDTGYTFIGFIDDVSEDNTNNNKEEKHPILCSLGEFEHYITNYSIDDVFLTLPIRSYYNELSKIIDLCITQGIKVHVVNDSFNFHMKDSWYDVSLEKSFIDYDLTNRSVLEHDLKRSFDILVSLSALVILIPVFVLVTLVMIIRDDLPIIYSQKRIGMNKRHFSIFKFRSMVVNAESIQDKFETLNEVNGAAFKITNDPRITKFGAFLRKTSLDEIPQFFNVLAGSMSVVGPRPLPARDYERFYKNEHLRRFCVKPGITGLWQVSGRNEIEFEEWMELDLYYIDNWNLWFDIKIFLKTIIVVVTGKGAR